MLSDEQYFRLVIKGLVQGVGFRPFLFRLAQSCQLQGWVQNAGEGVILEGSGDSRHVKQFIERIPKEKPAGAQIDFMETGVAIGRNFSGFHIRESDNSKVTTQIPLDVAMCRQCCEELFLPDNRRFLYPFITCTSCGPRFTILRALPFDRKHTSMAPFAICPACTAEYSDPEDRRFHAQTISCTDCGPSLTLVEKAGGRRSSGYEAIRQAAALLRQGAAIALKGLGGYHIAVDAQNDRAILQLRMRKRRSEKPFAVMFPDLSDLRRFCQATPEEEALLSGSVAPIVLLEPGLGASLAVSVNFDAPFLGAMLPHTPLHMLLLKELGRPLVMTSGNRAHAPIVVDDEAALCTLSGIVDAFLIHDRAIFHHADDSMIRVRGTEPLILRLGRGLAPCALPFPEAQSVTVALGGHQKNTFAVVTERNLIVSQHMGDLEDREACQRLEYEIQSYADLFNIRPAIMTHDLHPDYGSSRLARAKDLECIAVQHHEAHIMACAMEHGFNGQALALAWDGLGLGEQSELWGGEFYRLELGRSGQALSRIGSMNPFPLLGGDRAAREPRRCALGVASALFGDKGGEALIAHNAAGCLADEQASAMMLKLLQGGVGCQQTTSIGRLFDAVASLLDLKQICSFEGQAAMLLEGCASRCLSFNPYPTEISMNAGFYQVDWRPGMLELLDDVRRDVLRSTIAARFHHMLVGAVEKLLILTKLDTLLVSGGVFQNCFLLNCLQNRLKSRDTAILIPTLLPPHDGGLAAGQAMWAYYQRENKDVLSHSRKGHSYQS